MVPSRKAQPSPSRFARDSFLSPAVLSHPLGCRGAIMNFARFSVTRPVAVTMRIAALVLMGAICLLRLPIDLLPAVSIPTCAVVTQWPNVAPEEIEAQVTRPI